MFKFALNISLIRAFVYLLWYFGIKSLIEPTLFINTPRQLSIYCNIFYFYDFSFFLDWANFDIETLVLFNFSSFDVMSLAWSICFWILLSIFSFQMFLFVYQMFRFKRTFSKGFFWSSKLYIWSSFYFKIFYVSSFWIWASVIVFAILWRFSFRFFSLSTAFYSLILPEFPNV